MHVQLTQNSEEEVRVCVVGKRKRGTSDFFFSSKTGGNKDNDDEEEEEDREDEEEEEDDDDEDDGEDEEEENQRRYDFRQRKTVVRYQAPLDGILIRHVYKPVNHSNLFLLITLKKAQ